MGTTYKQDRLIDRYSDNGLFIALKIWGGGGLEG